MDVAGRGTSSLQNPAEANLVTWWAKRVCFGFLPKNELDQNAIDD